MRKSLLTTLTSLCLLSPISLFAQGVAPGPYEILPYEDGYIVEAFYDLLGGSQIADWTGWTSGTWISPNAYNTHEGTDISMRSGTPVYATVSGTVSAVVRNVPQNDGTGYGNYVKIQASGLSPRGETLDVLIAHLLPSATAIVNVGDSVVAGQLIGYSDNTGNSTSEHGHLESSRRASGLTACPFYNAHFKYPVMFNPNSRLQIGHVVKVTATQTPLRSDRFDTSSILATAHQDQLYFASHWKRGHYRVFLPNDTTNRSAWLRATDVEEVFSGGTVIQALPDVVTYAHATQLAAPYIIRDTANDAAAEIGRLRWGGGRFVADQTAAGGWYRVPVPGAVATWGWVKADSNMVIYPALYNTTVSPTAAPERDLPITNNFTTVGPTNWGRPKFDRGEVKAFSPSSPGGDGFAYFLTDAVNAGNGTYESISVGRVNTRNYAIQADIYCNYQPAAGGYERVGIFLRDDGFGGFDGTFEGAGNCYAMMWDTDDGRLRCCKLVNAGFTPEFSLTNVTGTAWRTFRIEAEDANIRFYLNGTLVHSATDSEFPSGPGGFAYSHHLTGFPPARGVYVDNFSATPIGPQAKVEDWSMY